MRGILTNVLLTLLLAYTTVQAQQFEMTVDNIMRDPKWIGISPYEVQWSDDGGYIYFKWNPDSSEYDEWYRIKPGGEPENLGEDKPAGLTGEGSWNKERTKKVYSEDGDIYLYDLNSGENKKLTGTSAYEHSPKFISGNIISFISGENIFILNLTGASLEQLTDFRKGADNGEPQLSGQKQWLADRQEELFGYIRDIKKEKKRRAESNTDNEEPAVIYYGNNSVYNQRLSPDRRFVTFLLGDIPGGEEEAQIPNYVTESGYTESKPAYPKVGGRQTSYKLGIHDLERDTTYYAGATDLPGIYEIPEYIRGDKDTLSGKPRELIIHGPDWSEDGKYAALVIRSVDNKDRWITLLDAETGALKTLDRQHDPAWIAGPGIGGNWSSGETGWMPDGKSYWFMSEESGYSHIYTVNAETGEKRQLTKGEFEVYSPRISRDKTKWYFTTNAEHPGTRNFYSMPLDGGEPVQITKGEGNTRAYLSPDEKKIAYLYSESNRPEDLYLMDNKPEAESERLTFTPREEWLSYNWRKPEIVKFKAEDGVDVYGRLYKPENVTGKVPAVIFVHGAGYLQNSHNWWSDHYFREYMFHNLLVDKGYAVMAIDYRGSAGYGRDFRTGIYRWMGGKDLSDHVDGAKYLVENVNADPEKIGIYGGSYGGFITLMAMFNHPEVFSAGAALRSVTDWAHYHHGYTSNILNTPETDSLAFVNSSPIYFAEGLEGALLMCHGMADDNVHFQDIVRLTQRLIELGKENWELAVYPVEKHSFVRPECWQDEYRRIVKLFEENLKNGKNSGV